MTNASNLPHAITGAENGYGYTEYRDVWRTVRYARTQGLDVTALKFDENTCKVAQVPRASFSVLIGERAIATTHGPAETERTIRALLRMHEISAEMVR